MHVLKMLSAVQVPVSFATRDPWVPVHLNTPGGSPRHYAPSRASAPSPGAVSEAQSEDWVLSMNGAEVHSRFLALDVGDDFSHGAVLHSQ